MTKIRGLTPEDRITPEQATHQPCPRCGRPNLTSYRKIAGAPACGCNWCGLVRYLTAPLCT